METDNLRRCALPGPMLPGTFDGSGDGGEEHVRRIGPANSELGIDGVEQPRPILKLQRLLTNGRSLDRNTKRHALSPQTNRIRHGETATANMNVNIIVSLRTLASKLGRYWLSWSAAKLIFALGAITGMIVQTILVSLVLAGYDLAGLVP